MATSINIGQIIPGQETNQNANDFALIKDTFTKYIVTPLNAFGLGGFVFDVEGETSSILQADITDHYMEDNAAVQDHIAIRPQRVVLRSYVGELVYRVDEQTNTAVQKMVQKLTTLSAFLPELSKAAQQVQSSLTVAARVFAGTRGLSTAASLLRPPNLNNIVDLWALTKNLNPAASSQQQAYLYFKALLEQKLLVSLQTPFEFVTNMAIERIISTQDESTRSMSDFSITLKKIRTVTIRSIAFDPQKYQNRSQQQIEDIQQQGNNQGQDVPLTSPLIPFLQNFGVQF